MKETDVDLDLDVVVANPNSARKDRHALLRSVHDGQDDKHFAHRLALLSQRRPTPEQYAGWDPGLYCKSA